MGPPTKRKPMQVSFDATVDWWARSVRGAAATGNHGERIQGNTISDPSQFPSAISKSRAGDLKRTAPQRGSSSEDGVTLSCRQIEESP
jgi:hypothetical protein